MLQGFPLEMEPGDELSVARAVEISGLDQRICGSVLDALMHAGLMMRLQHDSHVRCGVDPSQRRAS